MALYSFKRSRLERVELQGDPIEPVAIPGFSDDHKRADIVEETERAVLKIMERQY